ncbi:MAG TPA: M20/M25/M40 family metallo-hydrolase [Vicinamibacterales bacterium]|jgi:carboxypeptidase Q|nr:M20/M25/M40 family metallo-hydrolase [Vicinamibacterales bacterium]
MRIVVGGSLIFAALAASSAAQDGGWLEAYRETAARIVSEATGNRRAWDRLAELTDTFGPRLSGSENLERAIEWAAEAMKRDGLENVRTEPVMVPRWIRGRESAQIVSPIPSPLAMLGLGGSVGTPPDGIVAETLVVQSFADLQGRSADVKGRIVVFNVPFTSYGETVQYRTNGPSRAAALGAVAMLLRSVGPPGLRTPHTGALRYADGSPRIPAAAIAAEDAERLQRLQARGTRVTVRLSMEARFLPDVESANVVAEIRGRDNPEEVVVVGGHFDSWDVGTGATDDGGGCIATWEALRIVKSLGLRPRRTLRVVLFTNEENGLRGGLAYRDRYRAELSNHVLMIESDAGVFRPTGFGFSGSDAARRIVERIGTLLGGIDAHRIGPQGGGADIGPSVETGQIPAMSLTVDGNYFLIHHTPADTIDRIAPDEIARATAALAVMAYVVADMPERLR